MTPLEEIYIVYTFYVLKACKRYIAKVKVNQYFLADSYISSVFMTVTEM